MKVLIVEDDAGLAEVLEQTLSKHHYQVELATDGQAGWELVELFEYDLVLLDLRLPKLDGISFCHQLRASGYQVPVLLMTAENTQASKISGLDAGADDYVIKPLDLSELLARMRALLRRGKTETSPMLVWDNVSLNPSSCEVFCLGQRLNLTSKEYELLELLLRHQHRIFSLNLLMERLWTFEKMPSENAVRSHVKSLRRKLRQGGAKPMIETVYGLGYRLKPAPLTSVSPPLPLSRPFPAAQADTTAPALPANRDRVLAPLKDIWERHQQKYFALIDALEKAIPILDTEQLDSASALLVPNASALVNAQKAAHQLKGALGSFGFTSASQLAAQIERLLLVAPAPASDHIQQLPGLVQQLRQSLHMPATLPSGQQPLQRPDSVIFQWLIIDNDPSLIEDLIHEASIWGIQPHIATTLDEAKRLLKQHTVNVVLMDVNCSQNVDEGLSFLSTLSHQQPSLQIIVATETNGLIDRINLLRAGASVFLQKPVTASHVLETVTHSLDQTAVPSARILALDDDPVILACLKQLLMPWGFQLTLVSSPMEFWDSLEQNPPDLMILDIEMPDFNGLELCQVIRNDPALHQFPILFLSAHTDPGIIQRVFEAGADDYLSKPIIGAELVARILNRLERVRLLRTLAEVDCLTHLKRRRQSVEDLNRLLKLADRQQTSFCFAMLDLDQFKRINDTYGHEVGDQVLKTLGDYLRRTFRGEDVLARWGGEEFVVGLYGICKELAVKRLTALLKLFNQHSFLGNDKHLFHVSFSGGVAEYPQDGADIQSLYRRADEVLYIAKTAGRNQILSS